MKIQNNFVVPQSVQKNPLEAPKIDSTGFVVHAKDGFVTGGPDNSPAPSGPSGVQVNYFGGSVLRNYDVVPMYIGDYFKTAAGQKDVKHNDAFFKEMGKDKDFNGVLHQYGVDHGKSEKSHVVSGQFKDGEAITNKQIQDMLKAQLKSGALNPTVQYTVKPGDSLWAIAEQIHGAKTMDAQFTVPQIWERLLQMNPQLKDPNTIYPGEKIKVVGKVNPNAIFNFVLPPGAVLTMDDGTNSLQGLGGYHSSITGPDGKQIYYSAIAYSKGNNGIDFSNGNAQDNVSITESHEIAEAVTDPNVQVAIDKNDWTKLGWMDPNNGEIGDIEVNDASPGTPLNTMYEKHNGFAWQKIWSQEDNTNEVKPQHPHGVSPLPKPTPPPGS